MTGRETVLKVLLKQQHIQEHAAFRRAYDRAAATIDKHLVGGAPSKATLYRWLSGDLAHLPHPRHCQVLEALAPGWSAQELFLDWDDELQERLTTRTDREAGRPAHELPQVGERKNRFEDLSAVFTSRAEFTHEMPPTALFDNASDLRASGLSLNMICQHYGDRAIKKLLEGSDCTISLLFLDPTGREIQAREKEEGFTAGYLSNLTELNICTLERLYTSLSAEAKGRLSLRTYDDTIRFNITLVNRRTCVFQPYLPHARGLDSPAFVVDRLQEDRGLYPIFDDIFDTMWESASPR